MKQIRGYWSNEANILEFLSRLRSNLNLNSVEDWNSITQKQIQQYGGRSLLNKYSMYDIKCLGFPEGKSFYKKSIHKKSIGYWDNKNHVLQFLQKLKEKYNLNTPEDWNNITQKQILSFGGRSLFHKYSLYQLKLMACPEGKFLFNPTPKPSGYWENKDNVLQFLNEVKEKYNLNTPDDWNNITQKEIFIMGGRTLLHKYSIFELKYLACPEGRNLFNQYQFKPVGYWDDEQNVSQFVDQLKQKLNLQNPEDWNRLSKNQIEFHGGSKRKLSVKKIIQTQYPNSNIETRNKGFKRSSQRWLFLQVQKLFPHEEIVEDYFHSEISRESGYSVQFDIFLINKNIAIEYHGEHHFEDIPSKFSPIELCQERDKEKIKLCEKYGVQLVIIPYWWDNQLDSLKATLDEKIASSATL